MDLDADGDLDLLSGSYSRHEPDMAGLFQVLRGDGDGRFAAPAPLLGADSEPLIITAGGDGDTVVNKICTRPFAVDLNGDGKLDIVAGNFRGTFALFVGEGGGRFAPKSTWLAGEDGPLRVAAHSDPFLCDWDGDGDFDLLSGSAAGGAFLFENRGSRTEPRFAAPVTLLEPVGHSVPDDQRFGDAHLTGPQSATRVWASDVDGDGKLDLLIGDSVQLVFPAEGVDVATAQKRLQAWNETQRKVFESWPQDREPTEAESNALSAKMEALSKERETFVRDDPTGFVWYLHRR